MCGWEYPATRLELDLRRLLERTLNYWRGETDEAVHLPRPWPDPDAVPEEERAELEADLERRSAFRDR